MKAVFATPPRLPPSLAFQARCAREATAELAQAEALAAEADALNRAALQLPFGHEREALIYRAGLHQGLADAHNEEARRWREGK